MNINTGKQVTPTPFLKVYVNEVEASVSLDGIFPEQRCQEIEATKNIETKKHKLSAWRLFMRAVCDLGIDIKDINVHKTEFGKWVCDGFYFSISHSKNLVCVAVSSSNVGVDIQSKEKDYGDVFAKRILTPRELSEYMALDIDKKARFIDIAWCKKESIMKSLNINAFYPSSIEIKDYELYFMTMNYKEDLYFLSVCSPIADTVEVIDLKK